MKIKIIHVGRTKKEYLELETEFLKRLKAFGEVELVEVKEISTATRALGDDFLVVLDEKGKELDSREFADILKQVDGGELSKVAGKITFVIGGAFGLSDEVKQKADLLLSMSRMTFTHQMVKLFLLEQLYRGFCISAGREYHY